MDQGRNGQIWPFSNFPQNRETVIFSTPERDFDKNPKKSVFGQNGRNWIFSKKRLEHFFRVYELLTARFQKQARLAVVRGTVSI